MIVYMDQVAWYQSEFKVFHLFFPLTINRDLIFALINKTRCDLPYRFIPY